ncbi:hypothetical protein E5288_WYG000545 [Bos mutus]|uniref:Glyceraldehyde 3-phosphate dehydrogenase NAD(P) binding domain-containing protein n=1 Tax=Bos mutus TaxID=72004 RepID=A0A6B0QNX9_9CETA|nr:hypothetical protein [Bos mutus]
MVAKVEQDKAFMVLELKNRSVCGVNVFSSMIDLTESRFTVEGRDLLNGGSERGLQSLELPRSGNGTHAFCQGELLPYFPEMNIADLSQYMNSFLTLELNANLDIIAISDPIIDLHYMVYVCQYDSIHGNFHGTIKAENGKLIINGKAITIFQE